MLMVTLFRQTKFLRIRNTLERNSKMSVSSLPTTKDIEPVILENLSDREIHELQDIVAECANRFDLTIIR
jgi:hypothetical protein